MAKYFAAEGVVTKHRILFASQDVEAKEFLSQLPAPVSEDVTETINHNDKEMQIAWRYQNLKTVDYRRQVEA